MNIKKAIKQSIDVKSLLLQDDEMLKEITHVIQMCIHGFKNGRKMYLCGNGGSAADAQHIAAELSGRFNYDRKPLPAEALHVNTSFLTAVANDYDYGQVYARMVEAFGEPGDLLIAISTSGNSENVVNAVETAVHKQMHTIALTGKSGGKLASISDRCIKIPSKNVARIQEAHILIGHILCEEIEKALFPK